MMKGKALLMTLAMLTALTSALPAGAAEGEGHDFGPLRIGIKMVTGKNGNDHGGELRGAKGEEMCRLMHELGCDLTRIELRWTLVEQQRGVYDWSEYDRLVDLLLEYGIEPMFMMYCAPEWAMVGPPEDKDLFVRLQMENLYTVVWPRERYVRDFERFIETAAKRYEGKVRLYEYWNEPDGMAGPTVLRDENGKAMSIRFGGDAVLYADWLRVMYPALKKGNPDAVLCVGSLTDVSGRFIEGVYASGCRDMIDAVSVHPYADNGIHEGFVENVREIMCRYGDWEKPIWLTEFGWSCSDDPESASAKRQADVISAVFDRIEERFPCVTQAYFFTLNDWRGVEEEPGSANGFGVVNYDLKKKPGFDALIKVMNKERKQVHRDRRAVVTFTGPSNAIDVLPGTTLNLEMCGYNPMVSAVDTEVKLRMPWQDEREAVKREFRLLPGATKINVTGIEIPDYAPGAYDVVVEATGFPSHALNLTVPYEAVYLTPQTGWEQGEDLAPQPPSLKGKGEQGPSSARGVDADQTSSPIFTNADGGDLIEGDGFRAWFGYDDQNLYFACEVEDTEHRQTKEGFSLWEEDSVQLAIDPLREGVQGAGFRPDDSSYIFTLTGDGPVAWRSAYMEGTYVGTVRTGQTEIERDEENGKTAYRIALPWTDICPFRPSVGTIIGVSIVVNDWRDGARHTATWGGGLVDHKEPYRFAAVRLGR